MVMAILAPWLTTFEAQFALEADNAALADGLPMR